MSGFTLHLPSRPELVRRQGREQRLYRSAAVGTVMRKRGALRASGSDGVALLPRGHPGTRADVPESSCIIEAIDTPAIHREFGIRGDTLVVDRVDLSWPDGRTTRVEYPRARCKNPGEPIDALAPHEDCLTRWNATSFRILRPDPATVPAEEVLLWAALDRTAGRFVAAVRARDAVLFFIPVFDFIVACHMHPFYQRGYYDFPNWTDPADLENLLVRIVGGPATAGGTPGLRPPWPGGKLSAFSVRHDYDRPIETGSVADLLDFYDEIGVRSTWFFLARLLPAEQIRLIRSRGHEAALHTEASSFRGFVEELDRFADAVGVPPVGYSCHGGKGSAGHLGQKQFAWAYANGLLYGEDISLPTHLPHPCISTLDCVPREIDLMLTPGHLSLDRNTKPDGHRLDNLAETMPLLLREPRHVILMNHPDIHGNQLRALVRGLDLSATWCCTIETAMDYFRSEYFASSRRTGGTCPTA